jgi:exodeoxyribonuclease-3
MSLRIATWNINSIRLRIDTVKRFVEQSEIDVLCLQETKAHNDVFPFDALRELGFAHIHAVGMKAYNGTAILSKVPFTPIDARQWCEKDDCRHSIAALSDGTEIHNFYVPAGGDIPDPVLNVKFAHKLRFLDEMESWFAARSNPTNRMILVGDLNIAPLETDVWSHKALLKIVSHTPIEVERLNKVQASHHWVDAVRRFIPPEQLLYTWWSYRARDWEAADKGRRLDHVWVTPSLESELAGAEVERSARGWTLPSDHVPVIVTLK